ncbi:hypothetical protein [Dyella terrae]|nr:hypothetical protein [Dyella terrae]
MLLLLHFHLPLLLSQLLAQWLRLDLLRRLGVAPLILSNPQPCSAVTTPECSFCESCPH